MLLLESFLLVSNSTMDSDFLEYFAKPVGIGILILIAMALSPEIFTIFLNIKKKIANANIKKQIELFSESDVVMQNYYYFEGFANTKQFTFAKCVNNNGYTVYECTLPSDMVNIHNNRKVVIDPVLLSESEYKKLQSTIQEFDKIRIKVNQYTCVITNEKLIRAMRNSGCHIDETVYICTFEIPQFASKQLMADMKQVIFNEMKKELLEKLSSSKEFI